MIETRIAESDDYSQTLPLLHQLWKNFAFNENDLMNTFSTLLSDPNAEIYLVEYSGNLIALISLTFRFSLFHQGKVMIIEDFIVKKEFRKQGIGTDLVSYAENIALQKGCKCIELNSDFHRLETHQFWINREYKKLAYQFRKKMKNFS